MSTTTVIICEPPTDCADPHPCRWYCMGGHDGAEPGVCPLKRCEQRGANSVPTTPDSGTD